MKKIIFALLLSILIPATTLAWDDCPHGEIDCPAPGDCNRYVDTDNDGICDHSQPAPEDRNIETTNIQVANDKNLITNNKQNTMTYHLIPISLFLIIFYAITRILVKKKNISVVNHKKIWNVLLLISFLISGILGIVLIIEINFGTKFLLPFNILFWHVEIGIAMFIICMLHIIERWNYFKNLFMIKK